jgi:hypothetical protein
MYCSYDCDLEVSSPCLCRLLTYSNASLLRHMRVTSEFVAIPFPATFCSDRGQKRESGVLEYLAL